MRITELAVDLAQRVPVLHDVSDGGLAVSLAEVCIASEVGARFDLASVVRLFAEDPHRLLVAFPPGEVSLPPDFSRRVGVFGGDAILFGDGSSVSLEDLATTWRSAISSRLGPQAGPVDAP